jgi:hypothetical protein
MSIVDAGPGIGLIVGGLGQDRVSVQLDKNLGNGLNAILEAVDSET